MTRIGIMGGTFDPIHHGHLVCAEAAHTSYDLDLIIFVPAARPPHKDLGTLTSPLHRLNMTVLATTSNPHLQVSAAELQRPGLSYTIDTIRQFRGEYGRSAQLFFITGSDALAKLMSWRDPYGLLAETEFIAAERAGYPQSALDELIESLPPQHGKRLHRLEIPALAISSTAIRERVRRGDFIKYLVPEAVEQYIIKNGLYRDTRTNKVQ